MVTRCEKCGQTILQTDATCWHCGAENKQRGNKSKPTTAENGQGRLATTAVSAMNPASAVEEELEPVSLTAVFAYAIFTLICFIMLGFIVQNLANKPLFLLNPELNREPDWQTVTDTNLQFTLDIPQSWTVIENKDVVPAGEFAKQLQALNAESTFTSVETKIAGDVVPYMLVQHEQSPAYLLITGSRGLQVASNTQIMGLVDMSGWEILRIAEIEPTTNDIRINVAHYLEENSRETRCTTQFVTAEQTYFILIGCAPTEQFPQFADEIVKMNALFQPLIYQN